MSKRRALVVLGMHRSGTSALSRVLSLRGAELPAHVMAANRGNTTGYWEPKPIVDFNDEMLDYFGVDWDDPFAEAQLPAADAFPKKFHTRGLKLLDQEYGDADLFVLKDPRCTLLHAFWFDLLAARKVTASPVVVMRPYAQVAESLLRRDQTHPEASVLVYVAYGLAAAAAVKGRKATFLTYDQLVSDWKGSSDRIAAEQGFKWPRIGKSAGQEVAQFLEAAPAKAGKLDLSPTLAGWADAVWNWFRAQAEGGKVAANALEPIRKQLAEAGNTFAPVLAERRRRLGAAAGERTTVEQAAQDSHHRYEQAQADLARTAAERDELLAERDRLLALYETTQSELARTQAAYAEARSAVERGDAGAGPAAALLAQRDALLAERDRLLAVHEATSAELQRTQKLYAELDERAGRQAAELAALQGERDRALALHDAAAAELHRTQQAYADLDHRAAQQAGHATSMQSERDRVLALYDAAQAELARVNAAFRTVEIDAVRAVERLAAQDAAHAEARATIEKLDNERRTLAGQREQLQSERDRLLALYDAAQAELSRTQAAFRDADAALAQASTRAGTLEGQYTSLQAAHEALDREHRALMAQREALQGERDKLLPLYEVTNAELGRTQQAHQDVAARLANAAGRLAEVEDALAATRAKLEHVEAALAAANHELDTVRTQNQALAAERDTFIAERDRLLALYEQSSAELQRTQQLYAELDARATALAAERDGLEHERDGALAALQSEGEAAAASRESWMAELAAQRAEAERQAQAAAADYQALADAARHEAEDAQARYAELTAELERTQQAWRVATEAIEQRDARLVATEARQAEDIAALEAQRQAEVAALAAAHDERAAALEAQLAAEAAARAEQVAALEARLADTAAAYEAQRAADAAVQAEQVAAYEAQRAADAATHAEQVAAYEALRAADAAAHAEQVAALEAQRTAEAATHAEQVAALEAQRVAEAAAHAEQAAALEAQRTAEAATHAEQVAALEAQRTAEAAAHAEQAAALEAQRVAELAAQAAAFDERLAALQAGWRAERDQAAAQRNDREGALTAQIAGLRGEVKQLATARDAAQAQAEKVAGELQALKERFERINASAKQLEAYVLEAERRHEEFENEIARVGNERQALQAEQYRLLGAQQAIEDELDMARQQLQVQDAELATLRADIERHLAEKHQMTDQIADLRQAAEQEAARHRADVLARVQAWEQKLQAAKAQMAEMRAAARAELDDARAALAAGQLSAQATQAALAADIQALHDALGQAEAGREELAAQLRQLGEDRDALAAQLQLVVEERDQLQEHLKELAEERERVRAWSQQLGAELGSSHAMIAELGKERDELQTRLWAVLDEQRKTGDELEDIRAQREYLQDDLRDTRASLRQTSASLQELGTVRAELQSLSQRLQAELAHAQASLQDIYHSRSWRITEPLRRVTIAGRRVIAASTGFIQGKPRLLSLPAPQPAAEAAAPAEEPAVHAATPVANPIAAIPTELLGLPEPEFTRRRHPGLRAFLVAEFGETAAAAALLRIDRYRLPIDTAEVRGTAKATCTEDEARYWAAALARRAERRHMGGDAPDVSIVMPVYNQIPFTLACIDSLLALQSKYTFEILVGDDASTDATAAAFALPIPGVTHVRHAQNLGFVRNCNATATHARGRYVLMLNNDTQVLPGWLDELVDVLEGNLSVGMVGSKLIFPDGRMQECGGIIWKDGSAWNFGRLDNPRKPEYCYLRGVDYVSGASILLPTALWKELGGFDEHFVPAYAEDVDLAFRVRAAGLYTMVQPLSQLIHFEGVSSGTDLGQGAKAYQVANLEKLHKRWKTTLAGHRDNAVRPDLEKERHVARRVLFVDHVTLTPNEDAGSLVAFEILKSFSRLGYKVTFIPEDNFAHMGADTRALQRLGIETIFHPAYSRMEQFIAARQDPFDVVVMHHYSVGDRHYEALRAAYPEAKFVFLACDLHYLREMREAELSGDAKMVAAALQTKERELAVARAADAVMVYSETERDLLAQEMPGANVVLFPLVHDPIAEHVSLAGRDGVCFVAGYRHPPNVDGILWFVEHSWPLVRAKLPDRTLYVAGSHMPDEVRALGDRKGVEIVGYVEDLEAFLAQRRVNVAPLRYGAGVKGKVAVAAANGLPTVCTPIAAEGMQLKPGVDVLVGQDPAELATLVIEMLEDDKRWQQVSDAGLEWAGRVSSRAAAHRRIRKMLGGIGLPPPIESTATGPSPEES